MKLFIGIIVFFLLGQQVSIAQVPVADVRIACSSEYFKENDEQHALIVRGLWCQDMYFWSIINIGDTIDQLAYYQDSLFTGECVDYNIHEQLIGRYSFDKGFLTRLQEYDTTGVIWREFNFASGIPNGKHVEYNEDGSVEALLTFEQGRLNGPFVRSFDFYDYGLGMCVEKGSYIDGVQHLESLPCIIDDSE